MENIHSQTNSKRLSWIDWCRAFAICCVLLTHTTERVYALRLPEFADYYFARQLLSIGLFTVGRLGVPIFFMISGYLLLDRSYDFEHSQRFYQKNLLALILTTELWIVIYNLFNAWFYEQSLSVSVLIRNMLFLQNTEMSHMWYMPVIIGIYLFLPFLANALQHTDRRIVEKIIGIAFIGFFIIPELNVLLAARGLTQLSALLDLSFSGGCYGIYFIIGYLWKKGCFDRIRTWVFPLLFVAGFLLTIAVQLFSFKNGIGYAVWYNNASLLIAAFSVFAFFARMEVFGENAVIQMLAICSFGIYLVHNPINMLLVRHIHLAHLYLCVIVIFSMTLALSLGGVYLLSRNKHLGKVFFFIK